MTYSYHIEVTDPHLTHPDLCPDWIMVNCAIVMAREWLIASEKVRFIHKQDFIGVTLIRMLAYKTRKDKTV